MADPQVAASVGQIAASVGQIYSNVSTLVSLLGYVAGIGFGLRAALSFKSHSENPDRTPISQPVTLMMVAALALALPTFLQASSDTLFEAPPMALAKQEAPEPAASPKTETPAPEALAKAEPRPVEKAQAAPKAPAAPKPGLSAESFALAEQAAARELEAKGLGLSKAGQDAPSSMGDGGALAWVLGSLAALGAAGGLWARMASKRIRREKEAQAMPRVNLNASGSSGEA